MVQMCESLRRLPNLRSIPLRITLGFMIQTNTGTTTSNLRYSRQIARQDLTKFPRFIKCTQFRYHRYLRSSKEIRQSHVKILTQNQDPGCRGSPCGCPSHCSCLIHQAVVARFLIPPVPIHRGFIGDSSACSCPFLNPDLSGIHRAGWVVLYGDKSPNYRFRRPLNKQMRLPYLKRLYRKLSFLANAFSGRRSI